jgi:hypothetical protein
LGLIVVISILTPIAVNDLAAKAIKLFKGGLDCQEAIMRVFDEKLQLKFPEEDLQAEPCRRSGLGATMEVCGAVKGALRVLAAAAPNSVEAVKEFIRLFSLQYGGTSCRHLTYMMKWGDCRVHCDRYVKTAAERLCGLLAPSSAEPPEPAGRS